MIEIAIKVSISSNQPKANQSVMINESKSKSNDRNSVMQPKCSNSHSCHQLDKTIDVPHKEKRKIKQS